MSIRPIRLAFLVIAVASAGLALADQKIKTKSNIKNDRMAETAASGASAPDAKPVAEKTAPAAKPKQP